MQKTVYLDNAATSFPKPREVADAVQLCIRRYGGNPGRSGHRLALEAQQIVYDCRCALSEFFSCDAPERVVFTYNTTYALNLVLKGLIRAGDHVLISNLEHNSVLRPIHQLQQAGVCTYDVFSAYTPDASPALQAELTLNSIRAHLRPNTRVLCCTHASNLGGVVLPLEQIGAFCRAHHLLLVVDAAQSAGTIPIFPTAWGIDALCLPAHKGLYGISGCGAILFSERLAQDPQGLQPVISGGSGVYSADAEMPPFLPERLEGGTLATPAIAALRAGLGFLKRRGISAIAEQEAYLAAKCKEALLAMPSMRVFAPQWQTGTLLFAPKNGEVGRLCEALDRASICCRSGFHCAPLAHQALQTGENGAIRVSFGAFNTVQDANALIAIVQKHRELE